MYFISFWTGCLKEKHDRKSEKIFKTNDPYSPFLYASLLPALYNISFLTSMWDPLWTIRSLPVAVVNQDSLQPFR